MWLGAKLINSHKKPTERCMTLEVSSFMKISGILTPKSLQTLICWSEVFPVSRSQYAAQEKALQMKEVIFSLNLPEFLKVKDLAIFA